MTVSKEILRNRNNTSLEQQAGVATKPAANKGGLAETLTADMFAAALSRRPILLVGDVGAGKTTFIRHLIKIDAPSELERAVVLYLDFGHKPAVVEDLTTHAATEIERQLNEDYQIDIRARAFVRGVYHGELRRFSRGIYADLKEHDPAAYSVKEVEHLSRLLDNTDTHLQSCFNHITKGQNRQVVIFLDNVDQRSAAFQDEAFVMAQAMATNWPATIFVSLRPSTFLRSKASGSLSAYQPRVFTISPPRVDLVIQRRLAFANKMLEETGRLAHFPTGLQVRSNTLTSYIAMLIETFGTAAGIIEFVDNMSNGNVRKALEFITAFVHR